MDLLRYCLFILITVVKSNAWMLENIVTSNDAIDVCLMREANNVTTTSQPKCPVPHKLTLDLTCGLQEEEDEVSNGTCHVGEDATTCYEPIPQPVLCQYLGEATSCSVCLKPVQAGSCGGLMTFSLFAVTGSGLAVFHHARDIMLSDQKFALKGNFLENLFLLKELFTGAISAFVVVINVLVHFDRRRFVEHRELRGRLIQLLHILYGEILVPVAIVFQVLILVPWFWFTALVNRCHQFSIVLYMIRRLLTQMLNGRPWMCLSVLLGLRLQCGCWRWGLKRSHEVDDKSCCSPGNLRRASPVNSTDVPEACYL